MKYLANKWIIFKRNITAYLEIPTISMSFFEYLFVHKLVKGNLS